MEFIVFLVFVLLIVVVVGAVMGIVAKAQVAGLRRQVLELTAELRELRLSLARAKGSESAPDRVSTATPGDATSPSNPMSTSTPAATATSTSAPPPLPAATARPAHRAAASAPENSDVVVPEPENQGAATSRSGASVEPNAGDPELTTPLTAPESGPRAATPPPLPPERDIEAATAALLESPPESESGPDAQPAAPPSPSGGQLVGMEKAVGLRWLTWVGIVLLFLGVAFFLKYAYDRDWLGRLFGPRLRIATAAGIAVALIAGGWRSLRNGFVALGQGLLGGGQALLYLTVFAAFQPAMMVVEEPLLGPTTAFGLMVAVTIAGLAVAVRLDAVAMAVLAVLGGFATPVLMSTGRDARDLLCAYLLLLDLGVLGVTLWRRWRALDLLAFAGTVLLFGGWWASHRHAHPQPDATVVWLAVFHLVFLLLPFLHHWRRRTPVTVERFALALMNVAWTMAYGAWLLHEAAPRLLAGSCLVAAGLYLVLGVAVARRVGNDRRTRDGFLALATLLLTLGLFSCSRSIRSRRRGSRRPLRSYGSGIALRMARRDSPRFSSSWPRSGGRFSGICRPRTSRRRSSPIAGSGNSPSPRSDSPPWRSCTVSGRSSRVNAVCHACSARWPDCGRCWWPLSRSCGMRAVIRTRGMSWLLRRRSPG